MGQVKKYAFRRRLEKHNYSCWAPSSATRRRRDAGDPGDGAPAAGLDASALSHMEERDFAHVTRAGAERIAQYLSVR